MLSSKVDKDMAYDIVATTKTPTSIICLIDISGSMDEESNGARKIENFRRKFAALLCRNTSATSLRDAP